MAPLEVLVEALAGEPIDDPAGFADSMLAVVSIELGMIADALRAPDPNPRNVAEAVWRLSKRVDAAREVVEALWTKGSA